MFKVLGTFLIGFVALAILAWGWIYWLPLAMQIGDEHGPVWRGVAMAGMGLLTVALAWGFWRLQDVLGERLDYRGRALPDRLFCQRCGEPVAASAIVCASCGGTRFGVGRPAGR